MSHELTRRHALGLFPSVFAAAAAVTRKTEPLPQVGEFVRFPDPTTETPVVRLTTPAWRHLLPLSGNRFVLLKPRVLYCSSDRAGGRLSPFQIDLRTGTLRQVAECSALDPLSLSLDAPGRFLYLLDGSSVCRLPVSTKHDIHELETVVEDVSSFAIGASNAELFVIRKGTLQKIAGRDVRPLAEGGVKGRLLVRPGGGGVLFTRPGPQTDSAEQEFWYAAVTPGAHPVLLAKGGVHSPCWTETGSSLLFLRDIPKANVSVAEIREVIPEAPIEHGVAPTSQFATFATNPNDSMLVGASNSKAQPYIVLLLRSLKREMTLCEHRASAAVDVRPSFSPDSRRVYFGSDREGKPAIYSVNVEQLVEPT